MKMKVARRGLFVTITALMVYSILKVVALFGDSVDPLFDIIGLIEGMVIILSGTLFLFIKFSKGDMSIRFLTPAGSFSKLNQSLHSLCSYSFLLIREGSTEPIENKISKVLMKDNLAILKKTYNPKLGFEFKSFCQINDYENMDSENKLLLAEQIRKEMFYMGFNDISKLTNDGRIWFLFPGDFQMGVIQASERERIFNNIYYPTLPDHIGIFYTFRLKIPMRFESFNFCNDMKLKVNLSYTKQDEEKEFTKTFAVETTDEERNIATLSTFVEIKPALKTKELKVSFKVSVHSNIDKDNLIDHFQRACDEKNINDEIIKTKKDLHQALIKKRNQQWDSQLLAKLSRIAQVSKNDEGSSELVNEIEGIENMEGNTIQHLSQKLQTLFDIQKQRYDIKLVEQDNEVVFVLQNNAKECYGNIMQMDEETHGQGIIHMKA